MEKNRILSKTARISKEIKRLKKIFKVLAKSDMILLEALIENAAFMRITLEDLQSEIIKNGTADVYKNGANQYGTKASAELQAYNSTIKNYALVLEKLKKYLPKESEKDELMDFLK